MSRILYVIVIVSIFLTLCTAQSDAPDFSHDNAQIYAPLLKAPKRTASRPNPFENDPQAVAAGRKLFDLHCAECHGAMAEGSKKAPSLRADEVQSASPGSLFWILTNGVGRRGMPVWSKLPEPQRWQLVSFIKSLRVQKGDITK